MIIFIFLILLATAATQPQMSPVSAALFQFDEQKNFIPPQRNDALRRVLAEKPKLDVFETAAVGDAADLERMLRQNPTAVSTRNHLGWTPLHYAAFGGNTAAIRVLLARGADVHARAANRFRNTPLIVATLTGQVDAAKLLLDSGADVLDRQANGFSTLHEAAFSGKLELVRLYVDSGAELNSRSDDGRTPLSEARRAGHEAVVKFLEAKGAVAGPTGQDVTSAPE
ncbi:MAG TPA: ankyrin repeat domain-containing protein [Thermoanaerobaculia bacterium]|nr:ankyrin repeat domain-containing protein [Thermoanaerobaculia bacterium]